MQTWWNDYIGINYKEKGRDKDGLDCWGLVRLIYKEQYQIDLPSFTENYESDEKQKMEQLLAFGKEGWEKVDTPTIGDVVLLRILGLNVHVGVIVSPNQFIHVREATNTTIERFDTGIWKHRIEGFYRYVEKVNYGDVTLAISPHPLKTERIDGNVPAESSVAEIIDFIKNQYPVAQEYNVHPVIFVNGKLIPQEEWDMVPKEGDVIQYRAVAEGDVLKTVFSIAVMVAASYIVGPEMLALSGWQASLVQAGISIVGNLLINAIFPVRPPSMALPKDPGNAVAQNLLQGGSNQASLYGAIPVVLGQTRFTAPLGAQMYVESNTDTSYLRMILVWGYGPLQVSDMRIGSTDINGLFGLTQETLEGFNSVSPNTDHFNSIYPKDVMQDSINVEMAATETTKVISTISRTTNVVTVVTTTAHSFLVDNPVTIAGVTGFNGSFTILSTPTTTSFTYAETAANATGTVTGSSTAFSIVSPWYERTINQEATSVSINLHFPQGLRQIAVDGSAAGTVYEQPFSADVQVRKVDSNTLVPLEPWSAVEKIIKAKTVTITDAFFGSTSTYAGGTAFTSTPTPCYQWTVISLDEFNNFVVRKGSYSNTSTADPSGTFLTALKQSTGTLPTSYKLLPTIPATETVLYHICMYGSKIFSTVDKRSLITGTYTGLGLTTGTSTTSTGNTITTMGGFLGTQSATVTTSTATVAAGTLNRTGRTASIYFGVAGTQFVQRKDAFSYSVYLNLPQGKYNVRIRRNTTTTSEYTSGAKYMRYSASILTSMTAYGVTSPIIQPKPLAMTAIRVQATDQINQNLEGISATVTSICLDWDAATTTWVMRPTRNPASLFRYVLQHPANAQAVPDTQIDLTALEVWHAYCETNIFQYDEVVTDQKSLLDVLKDICAAGRSSPALRDGKWTVITDKVRTSVAQYFTPHNSWGFESVKALPKLPHGFRVQFKNSQKGFQPDEYIVYNDGYDASNATILETIALPGVTTPGAVYKHARFHFAQLKLRPETYTLNADIEHLVCTRGDLVKLSHDVPMWGLGTGRIAQFISTTSIRLDEQMPMTAGVQYTIRIRLEDGSSITRTVAAQSTSGYYDTITLTTAITSTQGAANNLFMFGSLSSESTDLIVQSIEPSNNMTARITLVDYSPAVYDSDTGVIPAFNSNVTLPPTLLVNEIVDVPTVISTVSDESVMTVLSPGQYQYNIKVAFTNPKTLPKTVAFVEGQIDYAGDTSLTWQTVKSVLLRDGCIYFSDVQEGSSYRIRIRYATADGRTSPWTDIPSHTVVGRTTQPSAVLNVANTIQTGMVKVSWDANPELDVIGYEVRTSDTGWGSTSGYVFKGDATSCLVTPAASGIARTWYVRAYDSLSLYSATSASTTYTLGSVPAISAPSYSYVDTSLTSTSITLTWTDVSPTLGLSHYIVSYGAVVLTSKSNTITLPVDWTGSRVFSIVTVDTQGNQSSATTLTVAKATPNAPGAFTATVTNGQLVVKWDAATKTTLPIAGYEIRSSDTGWGTSGYLFKGDFLDAIVTPAVGLNTWYIRAYDTANSYSTTSLSATYTRALPFAPTSPTYVYADTSLTNATVSLDWVNATPVFNLDRYKITYGAEVHYTKSNTITLPADWLGDRVYSIYTIDMLGGESTPVTLTATKVAPNPASNMRAQVIDNNVLLYWTLPAKTSLPVQDVMIKKGATWATATEIGSKAGAFTSLQEISGGTYTYWIAVRDTDNNYSTPISLTTTVSQPPDFIFNAQYFSTFTGTKTSAINDTGGVLMPVNTTETWTTHFTSRSWTTPSAQVSAGYPIFIQPNNGSGSYVEVFDYGTVLGSSQITVNYTGTAISGSPTLSFTIGTSIDGITYTTFTGSAIFATNFRYIKVTANIATSAATDLYKLNTLNVLLNAKLSTDAGSVSALSTDTTGTIVNLNKEFVDVISITLAPSGTAALSPVYDFLDSVINGTYTLTSNVATINVTGHNLLAGQKVRLGITSGTAPSGVYTVASVVNANQYTVNITTANTSGNISTYPESFRVYLFDANGVRVSGTVSWSVRGY